MRVFVLAAAAAVASLGLNCCTSPGYYNGGFYSGAPYAPGAVAYPGYGFPPPEAPPISAYGAYVPPRADRSPRAQVYSAPQSPPAPARYSGKPQVYSGPTRPYSRDQSYGSTYRP